MSAKKGSNGIADGKKNEQLFLEWKAGTDDFKPYVWQGKLNKSRIARECGFVRQVFETNDAIRDIHFPALIAELEGQGILQSRVASPSDRPIERSRSQGRSAAELARIKQIQEEAEAVKAENRELRAQLKKLEQFKCIDEIVSTTGRLPW